MVQKRLMLPEEVPYVDAYRYSPTGERIYIGETHYDDNNNVEMSQEEAVEGIVIFEDEHPKYVGTLSNVTYREEDELDEDDNPTGDKYRIYTFKDAGLKNFTNDFRLDGESFRLTFQTGKLAGLDFELLLQEIPVPLSKLCVMRITAVIFLMTFCFLLILTHMFFMVLIRLMFQRN